MFAKLASFENDIAFPRLWRIAAVLSSVVLVVAALAFGIRGLNLGIDFEGGTAWEVPAPGVSVADARDTLGTIGQGNAKIQIVGGDTLRVQAEPTDQDAIDTVTDTLAELAAADHADIGVSIVGPTWGDEISSKALRALIIFFVVVAAYIAVRLEWKMAVGALVAVIHDILISVGVYSLFQFEITPATVIAFLTIMGYSLYDTIVVFDKVQENADRPAVAQKFTYTDMMSLSMNQVLMRSLNTTITSLLPVLSMLVVGSFILGAVTLQEFAVALLVGLIVGGYSSMFVAAPLVVLIKEREPQQRNQRRRLEARADRQADADAVASVATKKPGTAQAADTPMPADTSDRIIPPRPRKQGKRR